MAFNNAMPLGVMALLFSLAYYSRPICAFSDDELADLWECSTAFNETRRITGALYYDDEIFFQVLEGDSAEIEPLMQTIQRDPRHSDHTVVLENDIASPSFRFWPMKFLDGRASPKLRDRFHPDALHHMKLDELNANVFSLVML